MKDYHFIQKIDNMFQKLIPDSYEKQITQANKKPRKPLG